MVYEVPSASTLRVRVPIRITPSVTQRWIPQSYAALRVRVLSRYPEV